MVTTSDVRLALVNLESGEIRCPDKRCNHRIQAILREEGLEQKCPGCGNLLLTTPEQMEMIAAHHELHVILRVLGIATEALAAMLALRARPE